jgi:signal transduction histidine kinase/ActR/RegA family two-component response regulator
MHKPNSSAVTLKRIRADQVESLYRSSSIGLFATLVCASLLYGFLVFRGSVSTPAMTAWILAMCAQTGARLAMVKLYQRRNPPPEARPVWGRAFTLGALVGGICWGTGSILMITPAEFDIQLLVVVAICAIVYASLSGFGSYQPFYALLFPALVPVVVWSLMQGDAKHVVFGLMGVVWLPVVAWLGYRHDVSVVASYNLRYENLELLENTRRLLEEVRVQKERAEEANIAKSRFLASASHDLRQPVHALGMFVGAMRSHQMPEPATRLLGHIEGTVGALDGLFTALLDISRLDAGVIAVHPRNFHIQPLLERVCRDAQHDVEAKGLTLRLVPCRLIVTSDPVLLERILRNIVLNAVRYTRSGRILVGCRRDKDNLGIQVWDTGPGIPEVHRQRIFEEFFQVANPERDRSQGLGLGLAIVRRLCNLLNHPLRLKSQPGAGAFGAMFEVSVKLSQAAPATEPPPRQAQADNGRLVLVIDDEFAIQEAMRSLLESWGHTVITAGSCAQMLDQLAEYDRVPELILCDYRLRDGENGIAVIQRLQLEFNEEIPALLITGDTAPDRLKEARASGFQLLHKPLPAEELRNAINATVRA